MRKSLINQQKRRVTSSTRIASHGGDPVEPELVDPTLVSQQDESSNELANMDMIESSGGEVDIVPEVLTGPATIDNLPSRVLKYLDRTIEVYDADGVLVPVVLRETLSQAGLLAAQRFVQALDPRLGAWLITSTTLDLDGKPRTAESHSSGLAIDLAPIMSEEAIIGDTESISGLAWNVLKLLPMASAMIIPHKFCVEGDHIHLMISESKPMSIMPCFWSIAEAYPMTSLIRENKVLSAAMYRFWSFSPRTCTYAVARSGDNALFNKWFKI